MTGDANGAGESLEQAIGALPAGEAGEERRKKLVERLESYRKAPASAPPEAEKRG